MTQTAFSKGRSSLHLRLQRRNLREGRAAQALRLKRITRRKYNSGLPGAYGEKAAVRRERENPTLTIKALAYKLKQFPLGLSHT